MMSLHRRLTTLERRTLPARDPLPEQVRQAFRGDPRAKAIIMPRLRRAFVAAVAAGARDAPALRGAIPAADPDLVAALRVALRSFDTQARAAMIQRAQDRTGTPVATMLTSLINNLAQNPDKNLSAG